MNNGEDEISKLEFVLDSVRKELDQIALDTLRGALQSYPAEFKSAELAQRHERLTHKTDEVLDRISAIRAALAKGQSRT